ncbi:serine/threonine dehydratase [Aquipuribacter hungaricus]|uniref:serine/threonine dehydratase n=1 Tax=Aquipuribacter hungaricus TaxID=545624 RepID=UPI00362328AF
MISRDDVEAAREQTAGLVRVTPVLEAGRGALPLGGPAGRVPGELVLELELLQHTGSFKARGALHRVLSARAAGRLDPDVGVVVASGGNAGLAVAWAAARAGVPATVVVPERAPVVKVARLRELGATVVLAGAEYAEAQAVAQEHRERTGALWCHAYDQPEVAAGAGTLALELLEQVARRVDTVVVAVGGGGLVAGVAAALEGTGTRVVGAEPVRAPTLHAALAAGTPTDVAVSGVAADSLGARRVGEIAFDVARRTGVVPVLVEDADIVAARALLWREWRTVVEHGAAAALAALTAGSYVPGADERVAVVLCGANTDPTDL